MLASGPRTPPLPWGSLCNRNNSQCLGKEQAQPPQEHVLFQSQANLHEAILTYAQHIGYANHTSFNYNLLFLQIKASNLTDSQYPVSILQQALLKMLLLCIQDKPKIAVKDTYKIK